jgi:hypothetical protein
MSPRVIDRKRGLRVFMMNAEWTRAAAIRRQQHRHERQPERPREPALRYGAARFRARAARCGRRLRIEGTLKPAGVVPCDNPVLLTVSGNDRWFAAGISKR